MPVGPFAELEPGIAHRKSPVDLVGRRQADDLGDAAVASLEAAQWWRYFNVAADNPQAFIDALLNVTDVKQSLVCVPEFPPGWETPE